MRYEKRQVIFFGKKKKTYSVEVKMRSVIFAVGKGESRCQCVPPLSLSLFLYNLFSLKLNMFLDLNRPIFFGMKFKGSCALLHCQIEHKIWNTWGMEDPSWIGTWYDMCHSIIGDTNGAQSNFYWLYLMKAVSYHPNFSFAGQSLSSKIKTGQSLHLLH